MDGKLVPSLNVVRVGEQLRFTFNVANAGTRRVEVKFPSGQTHDIVVLDSAGRELWRWADGRMFTEARQYRGIGGGDSLVLEPAVGVGKARRGRGAQEHQLSDGAPGRVHPSLTEPRAATSRDRKASELVRGGPADAGAANMSARSRPVVP
jgi:hypothetical protein